MMVLIIHGWHLTLYYLYVFLDVCTYFKFSHWLAVYCSLVTGPASSWLLILIRWFAEPSAQPKMSAKFGFGCYPGYHDTILFLTLVSCTQVRIACQPWYDYIWYVLDSSMHDLDWISLISSTNSVNLIQSTYFINYSTSLNWPIELNLAFLIQSIWKMVTQPNWVGAWALTVLGNNWMFTRYHSVFQKSQ